MLPRSLAFWARILLAPDGDASGGGATGQGDKGNDGGGDKGGEKEATPSDDGDESDESDDDDDEKRAPPPAKDKTKGKTKQVTIDQEELNRLRDAETKLERERERRETLKRERAQAEEEKLAATKGIEALRKAQTRWDSERKGLNDRIAEQDGRIKALTESIKGFQRDSGLNATIGEVCRSMNLTPRPSLVKHLRSEVAQHLDVTEADDSTADNPKYELTGIGKYEGKSPRDVAAALFATDEFADFFAATGKGGANTSGTHRRESAETTKGPGNPIIEYMKERENQQAGEGVSPSRGLRPGGRRIG